MDNKIIKLLLIEDNPGDARLLKEVLSEVKGISFVLKWVEQLGQGLDCLNNQQEIDLVLLDLSLPDSHGLDTFIRTQKHASELPILVLSGTDDETLAVNAVQAGAEDYLVKGQVDGNLLWRTIRYAIERHRLLAEARGEIKERKRAEAALAVEKERLQVTLRSIGDGVITTDTNGNILLLNRVAEELTGWSQEQAFGQPLSMIFQTRAERTGYDHADPLTDVLNSGQIIELSNYTTLVARNGVERAIAENYAPIRDGEGWIIGAVVVFRDVSEKQKMEAELLKAQKLESVGILAGGIAHDFNNILMSIIGNLSLARLEAAAGKQVEQVGELLNETEKAVYRARELTQQLLTFAKGGAPIKRSVSLAEILESSVQFVLRGSQAKGQLALPPNLWLIEADSGQISQVVHNLVINAIQAMPNGGNVVVTAENISLTAYQILSLPPGNYVKFSVLDKGVGIQPEDLPKIFDPYFTTKVKGNGLGLATCYSIIKRHGGIIKVESKRNEGTAFHIYLPAASTQRITSQLKLPPPALEGKGHVLVMDDEEGIRYIVRAMLNRLGYEVEVARDGAELIEVYRQAMAKGRTIEAVIMDLTIPGGLGGKEALKELLQIDDKVKAIVSSGYSNDAVMANYREYGFKGMISKPYKLNDLALLLHEVIES